MSGRAMLIFSAISGFIAMVFGALGGHLLSTSLSAGEEIWIQTALNYQMYHTLALIGVAAVMLHRANIWFYWSGVLLALGIVMFSGSLYFLALSHLNIWVWITPIGGLCLLGGWILLLIGALRLKKEGGR